MARKPEQQTPPNPPVESQNAYEPAKGWRPLGEFVLIEALDRHGQPVADEYELNIRTGRFTKKTDQRKPNASDINYFDLFGLMTTSRAEDHIACGEAPRDRYDELESFWAKAAQDIDNAIVNGEVRVWARNGGIAGAFRPVAVDTWKKAYSALIESSRGYGAINVSDWIASCVYEDKLLGVVQLDLCSLYAEPVRAREKFISDETIIATIKEAEREKGKRLNTRELEKLRKEMPEVVPREKILSIEENMHTFRTRGRPPKQEK